MKLKLTIIIRFGANLIIAYNTSANQSEECLYRDPDVFSANHKNYEQIIIFYCIYFIPFA
jgi:hypothetical protein